MEARATRSRSWNAVTGVVVLRLGRLRALTDDPLVLIADAIRRVEGAERRIDWRLAAEEANLALVAALERIEGRSLETDRALRDAAARVARRVDRKIAATFHALRSKLHGRCYYGDRCPNVRTVAAWIGEAKALVERLESVPRAGRP